MNQEMFATADIRRFGYYIPKLGGNLDFVVHKQVVSAEVLIELHKISSVIYNLQPIIFAFDVVERNYRELVESIENHRSQLSNSVMSSTKPISIMDGFVIATQKISNFLSSTSAFLAQTETQLRRVYGSDSLELNIWNEKRHVLYDNNFSYRFLYELRNFAQHCSLPFSSIKLAGERASENAPILFKINAMILRDALFEVGFNWKNSVEVEIRKQPTEIELLLLIPEYFHILRQLCLETVHLHSVQLAYCARYFDAVRKKLNVPVGAVPVIFIGESTSKDIPPSRQEIIPLEQFDYLLREYDKLLNACELV
jgi:hypothetical protein